MSEHRELPILIDRLGALHLPGTEGAEDVAQKPISHHHDALSLWFYPAATITLTVECIDLLQGHPGMRRFLVAAHAGGSLTCD